MIIDAGDMDERNFSLAQLQTRVDAFMEMLLDRTWIEKDKGASPWRAKNTTSYRYR